MFNLKFNNVIANWFKDKEASYLILTGHTINGGVFSKIKNYPVD